MTTLSPANQAVVDQYTAQHNTLIAQRDALETEKLSILTHTPMSVADQTRLNEINNSLAQIAMATVALIDTPASEADVVLPTDQIALQAAREASVKQIIATIPPPPPGAYHIVHSKVMKGDMIGYMNATQYLNPYGRKRQCDTDLENIMSVINKDMNNHVAELNALTTKILAVEGS